MSNAGFPHDLVIQLEIESASLRGLRQAVLKQVHDKGDRVPGE